MSSSGEMFTLPMLISSLILLAAVINDFISRKVKNELVVISAIVSVVGSLYWSGPSGVLSGVLGLILALAMTLPLVTFGVLGAGDMKILMAFALGTTSDVVFTVVIYSLLWGALLGVTRAILDGKIALLIKNTAGVIYPAWRAEKLDIHKVPYTVAIFLGWTSYGVLDYYGLLQTRAGQI